MSEPPISAVWRAPADSEDHDQAKSSLFAGGGALGALAMSSCCILPLVLFSLGVSGAWIGNLTALYPYRPVFLAITAVFLAGGFYTAYRKPRAAACEPGSYCRAPVSARINRIVLWSATALVIVALAFPYAVPLLLDD